MALQKRKIDDYNNKRTSFPKRIAKKLENLDNYIILLNDMPNLLKMLTPFLYLCTYLTVREKNMICEEDISYACVPNYES